MEVEKPYPPGHNWEGLTPSQVSEGYEKENKKVEILKKGFENFGEVTQTEKESTLSEKEVYVGDVETLGRTYEESLVIPKENVKKSFKTVKEKLCLLAEIPPCETCLICKTINEEIGDKLI